MVDIKEEFSTKNDMLGIILSDMKNTYIINESSLLAGVIQSYLYNGVKKKHEKLKNLGVKQALFYVLHGANIPSVLTEVSFITNPVEGKRLRTKKYRELIARSLFSGIEAYMRRETRLSLNTR